MKINQTRRTSNLNSIIIFWSRKIRHFQQALSRCPLQSCGLNPSPQGFSLPSGLKGNILLFCHHSKNNSRFNFSQRFDKLEIIIK
jgi:hypothetical protein